VPRFIDITLEDYGLSSEDLGRKVGSLSAVVAVHMFGHAVDMDSISSVSGAMPIIEDCAQSLFSKYKGQYTGFLSEVSFFSFRSGKYISAGEGSAIFARDRSLDEAIRNRVNTLKEPSFSQEILHPLSTYVKSTLYKRPWYGTIGLPVGTRIDHKLNLTSKTGFSSGKIAKTDLRIINERIETFFQRVQRQKENSLYLLEKLKMKDVVLLHEKEKCWSNYYQFVIRFEHQKQRDAIADFLFDRGIDTAKYLDEVVGVATENYNYRGDCPNAELCSKTVLIIPNHYTLSGKDLDYIVNCVNEACERWKV
jgi:dTDP-4-amino-4,6-dideoxygalactose transaminase